MFIIIFPLSSSVASPSPSFLRFGKVLVSGLVLPDPEFFYTDISVTLSRQGKRSNSPAPVHWNFICLGYLISISLYLFANVFTQMIMLLVGNLFDQLIRLWTERVTSETLNPSDIWWLCLDKRQKDKMAKTKKILIYCDVRAVLHSCYVLKYHCAPIFCYRASLYQTFSIKS